LKLSRVDREGVFKKEQSGSLPEGRKITWEGEKGEKRNEVAKDYCKRRKKKKKKRGGWRRKQTRALSHKKKRVTGGPNGHWQRLTRKSVAGKGKFVKIQRQKSRKAAEGNKQSIGIGKNQSGVKSAWFWGPWGGKHVNPPRGLGWDTRRKKALHRGLNRQKKRNIGGGGGSQGNI